MRIDYLFKMQTITTLLIFALGIFALSSTAMAAGELHIYVDTFADDYEDNGNCSLREAITAINTHANRDACVFSATTYDNNYYIHLQAGTYQITRAGMYENDNATGDFDIHRNMEFIGSASGMTIIDGGGLDRVFSIQMPYMEHVQMERMIIQNGAVPVPEQGGGIYVGNHAEGQTHNKLTMTRCVVRNNNAGFGGGIALYNAMLYMHNSTVSGNNAFYNAWVGSGGTGGGIYKVEDGSYVTIKLYASTVTNNFADWGCSGIHSDRNHGGITLVSSILAGNRHGTYGDHQDICGTTEDVTFSFIGNTKNISWYFWDGAQTATSPPDNMCNRHATGNICNYDDDGFNPAPVTMDPQLSPLADNGGNTFTHAYAADSPVHHAGKCNHPYYPGSSYSHNFSPDQAQRLRGPQCSMGSFELILGDGSACNDSADCDNGNCMDGTCCTTACAYDLGGFCGGDGSCDCNVGWTGPTCSTCFRGYYGSTCTACPACANGTCNDGMSGDGTCACNRGWAGALCDTCAEGFTGELCDACAEGYYGPDCLPCPACDHGSCNQGMDGDGLCACETGWDGDLCDGCATGFTGDLCDACDTGYFGETCEACPPCVNGLCLDGMDGPGLCECAPGFAGDLCDVCASGHFGVTCEACPACVNGLCLDGMDGIGLCECAPGFAGDLCDVCIAGHFGDTCTACPACVNGSCNEGIAGDGLCACTTGWAGDLCDDCAVGYFGETCAACPACVNGACNDGMDGDGLCACTTGWTGELCDTCAEGYSGELCDACADGHFGELCETCPVCDHGSCNQGITGDGLCACDTGWAGELCNTCAEGWEGELCDTPICDPVCHEFASCTAPDTCQCNDGYSGDGYDCEEINPCAGQPDWTACDAGACFAETCETLGLYDRCDDALEVFVDEDIASDFTGYHTWMTVDDDCLEDGAEGPDAFYIYNGDDSTNVTFEVIPDSGVDVALVLWDGCGDSPFCYAGANDGAKDTAETLALDMAGTLIIQVILTGEPSGDTKGYSLRLRETEEPDGDEDVVDTTDDVDDADSSETIEDVDSVDTTEGVEADGDTEDVTIDGDADMVDKDIPDADGDATETGDVVVDGDVAEATEQDSDDAAVTPVGGSDDGCRGQGAPASFMLLMLMLGLATRSRRRAQA